MADTSTSKVRKKLLLKTMINGFFMALADSVPGVSGGTIALILHFYDEFIGSVNDFLFGDKIQKIKAVKYLLKLGIGWIIGMVCAVLILTSFFEKNIYAVSSLFMGFVLASIPVIIYEESETIKQGKIARNIIFLVLGIIVVGAVTAINRYAASDNVVMSQFSFTTALYVFFAGALAITAMFLPGISGSTILLVFGVYMPTLNALRDILSFNLSALPMIIILAFGILFGAFCSIKWIKKSLEKFRCQTVYAIIGMLIGSLYAIDMGPTTFEGNTIALNINNFNAIAFIVGIFVIFIMQFVKNKIQKKAELINQTKI